MAATVKASIYTLENSFIDFIVIVYLNHIRICDLMASVNIQTIIIFKLQASKQQFARLY